MELMLGFDWALVKLIFHWEFVFEGVESSLPQLRQEIKWHVPCEALNAVITEIPQSSKVFVWILSLKWCRIDLGYFTVVENSTCRILQQQKVRLRNEYRGEETQSSTAGRPACLYVLWIAATGLWADEFFSLLCTAFHCLLFGSESLLLWKFDPCWRLLWWRSWGSPTGILSWNIP